MLCSAVKWESGESGGRGRRDRAGDREIGQPWPLGKLLKRWHWTGAKVGFPDCDGLGGGSGEPDLESGLVGIEQVFAQGKVSPRFKQERGEEGQGGDGFDEVAACEQLH